MECDWGRAEWQPLCPHGSLRCSGMHPAPRMALRLLGRHTHAPICALLTLELPTPEVFPPGLRRFKVASSSAMLCTNLVHLCFDGGGMTAGCE